VASRGGARPASKNPDAPQTDRHQQPDPSFESITPSLEDVYFYYSKLQSGSAQEKAA